MTHQNEELMNNIDIMRKKSKAIGTHERKKERRVRMSLSKYVKSLGIAMGVGAAVVGAVMPAVQGQIEKFTEASMIGEYREEFSKNVVKPHCHLCENQVDVWYEYQAIASKMKEYDDFDTAVYLLCTTDSRLPIDMVMSKTQYDSLDNFLKAKGYSDKEEFIETSERKLVLISEIDERTRELDMMNQKYNEDEEVIQITGGIK